MAEEGRYIYSIIGSDGEVRNQNFGHIGINNQEVNLIHYQDIAAVVSHTPVVNFDRLDKTELIKYVAIHQKVNEEMTKNFDIAPMAFGVIAPSSNEVSRILEKAYFQFKMALKKVSGKVEFAVQVWWNPKKVLEELAGTDMEIQELKQKIFSKSSILAIPIKLKLGKLVHQKIEVKKLGYIKSIHAVLDTITNDVAFNKLLDEDMIANFSFLIEKTRESEFDKKMQELGKKYEGKLRFKYIGPMACYSFSNINLGLGNFEIIDEARKLLGLKEEVTFAEIKKTYYTFSHKYHPDKHGGGLETVEKMKKIIEAYRILENYCQSCDKLIGEGRVQKYSLKREDVANSLTIKKL